VSRGINLVSGGGMRGVWKGWGWLGHATGALYPHLDQE
jgi:hypothetical protein